MKKLIAVLAVVTTGFIFAGTAQADDHMSKNNGMISKKSAHSVKETLDLHHHFLAGQFRDRTASKQY